MVWTCSSRASCSRRVASSWRTKAPTPPAQDFKGCTACSTPCQLPVPPARRAASIFFGNEIQEDADHLADKFRAAEVVQLVEGGRFQDNFGVHRAFPRSARWSVGHRAGMLGGGRPGRGGRGRGRGFDMVVDALDQVGLADGFGEEEKAAAVQAAMG